MLLIAGIAGLFLLDSPWNVIAVCAAAVIEVGELAFWIRFLRRYRISTGAEGMKGQIAQVIDRFREGTGRVRCHGEIWAARSEVPLEAGDRVVVVELDGLSLVVEPPPGTEKGP